MKRLLLISGAVLSLTTITAQRAISPNVVTYKVDRNAELDAQRNADLKEEKQAGSSVVAGPSQGPTEQRSQPSTYTWDLLCGSMNVYGMLGSNQKPLNYYPDLGAISFIHRKSQTYNETPSLPSTAKSGVICAEVTTNWGASWDSTCIWSNATDWGRYPQGGIYNPNGNTNLANAYVIGMGPTVGANSFSGTFYASKSLSAFTTTAGTLPGEQQFFQFSQPPYPADMNRHGWSRNGFSVTKDNVVHAIGYLADNLAGSVATMRGYAIITGTFNGTAFDWKMDSIIPNTVIKSDGNKNLQEGQMIWNNEGTIGYVVGIGVKAGATLANRSYQPIVYKLDKTTNPAATWTLVNQLDFNTTFTTIPYHLPGHPVTYPTVTGDTTAIPFISEFDITIDANNNLHIGAIFMSGYSDHPDSLGYYTTYGSIINQGESYKWQHLPGQRPYIYDFIGDGTAPWKMVVVDSMSSEGPSATQGQGGYNENPWDPNPTSNNVKIDMDGRLQMGRTPDGEYISFSWSESDSLYTNTGLKFNTLPDVKLRLMAVSSSTAPYEMNLGSEVNTTDADNNVRSRATLHYMSPITSSAVVNTSAGPEYTVEVNVPLTVTNSNPYSQLTNNATWFGKAQVQFKFPKISTIGINENSLITGSTLYPNPSSDKAILAFTMAQSTEANVQVMNSVGQLVRSQKLQVTAGENKLVIDVENLPAGIYLINLKAGQFSSAHKLVVE